VPKPVGGPWRGLNCVRGRARGLLLERRGVWRLMVVECWMQIVAAAAVVVVVQWDVGCWNYCRPVKKYRTCLRLPHWDW